MLAVEGLGGGFRCGVGLYMDWVLTGLVGLLASTDLWTQQQYLTVQSAVFFFFFIIPFQVDLVFWQSHV